MPRPRKRISATAAAKILGCTSENVRQLAKAGLIDQISVQVGRRPTFYYYESQILERKSAAQEVLTLARDTEEVLQDARQKNEQAHLLDIQARVALEKSAGWQMRQLRLKEMAVSLLNATSEKVSDRDRAILTDLIMLNPVQEICDRYQLGRQAVSDIATKVIRAMLKSVRRLDELNSLRTDNAKLRHEKEELQTAVNYMKEHPQTVSNDVVIVMTQEDYAKRQILLKDLSQFFTHWSTRMSVNWLERNGIKTVADLVSTDEAELLAMPGVDVVNLVPLLNKYGLRIGMDLDRFHIRTRRDQMVEDQLLKSEAELNPADVIIRKKLLGRLAEYPLSVRAFNCLKAHDIDTFADLVTYSRSEIMKFRTFGRKSLTEIDIMLEKEGLSFGMNIARYGIVPKEHKHR